MKVIGISPLDKDATVSFVEDGRVLFAAGEERFSRIKQQDGFPHQAFRAGLECVGWNPDEVDAVAYAFLAHDKERELYQRNLRDERRFLSEYPAAPSRAAIAAARDRVPRRSGDIHGLGDPNSVMDKGPLRKLAYRIAGAPSPISRLAARHGSRHWARVAGESFRRYQDELQRELGALGLAGKLRRIDHHLSHAANSFYASGFERALIVTLDGYGSGLAGSVSEGTEGKIRRLHSVAFPNSLGTMYEHVTSALGFKPGRHEGKIVGLASYGDPKVLGEILLSRIQQADGEFRIYESNNVYFSRYLASMFPKIDVAAAYQHVLEEVACRYVEYWVARTGIDSIVLSGGVAANVKLNQRLFEIEGVKSIFVYPNMGDGGCGSGAAMYLSWPGGVQPSISDVYWGPSYSEREMCAALEAHNLCFERPPHLARAIAERIESGSVVARFDGRMEYGPRALGNRSVMYHAKHPEVNQWLNQRLRRTEFMPFAPVTLFEARERCYHNVRGAEHTAEFMTITFDCTEEMLANCPAAVHVDGTARPQLIRREVNPDYYAIVEEYERLTGVPSLINTSFNMHEEPIVNSPDDAVKAFLEGGLDYLAMGPFLVRHPAGLGVRGEAVAGSTATR